MKKVGIITLYYKTYNFGAQLQAYALQKAIEELGFECDQIRYIWCKQQTYENYANSSVDQKAFAEFSNNIKHTNKVYTAQNIADCIDDYDVFLVGSDQVWGVEKSMPLINLPVMTLSFVPEEKVKVSYAASLGSTEATAEIEEVLEVELPKFDALSVREKSAAEYLSNITGCHIQTVLDPVMLLKKDEWDSVIKHQIMDEKPYIFYYTAGADSKQKLILDKLQEEYSLPVKRVGYIAGDKIGPEDFIRYIKNAKYVVTDSFHATVFSLIYHKNIIVLPVDGVTTNRSKNIRLINLLDTFDVKERFVDFYGAGDESISAIVDLLSKGLDYEKVDYVLEVKRTESIKFLKKSLCIEKKTENYLAKLDKCTGCGGCTVVCPVNAIEMKEKELGFKYPVRDKNKCIDCGKCHEFCSYKIERQNNVKLIGMQSTSNNVRKNSSAGGVFYELARMIIANGGIVAACRYDKVFNVTHDFCYSVEDLDDFCRSKYVQSDAYKIFPQIKSYLKEGKRLLFVGTPCQTVALNAYLGRKYEKLYLVDLICGGVGAPNLWKKYLMSNSEKGKIKNINMRNKHSAYLTEAGFPAFSMKVDYVDNSKIYTGLEDYYLKSRLNFYRESCYSCRFKGDNHISDLTIGDFVGMKDIIEDEYDGQGTTLVTIRTPKGEKLLEMCKDSVKNIVITESKKSVVYKKNPMIWGQMQRKPQYYYMRVIFEKSSIEKIYLEDKYWDEFNVGEATLKNLLNEIKRNDLLLKTERAKAYHLWLDDIPELKGKVYIYGAGKLGRSLKGCIRSIKGFIDCNENLNSCEGLPVLHMGTKEIIDELNAEKMVSVIVTPVWDYDLIAEKLTEVFPRINVVSASELVGDIWI